MTTRIRQVRQGSTKPENIKPGNIKTLLAIFSDNEPESNNAAMPGRLEASMNILKSALFATSILAFAGCAAAPQNPIYAQTTKYKGSNPYVVSPQIRQAGYQAQIAAPITYAAPQDVAYNDCISKESNRKLIGTGVGAVVGGIVGNKIGGRHKTLGTLGGAAIGGAAGYGIADKTIRCDRTSVQTTASAPNTAPISQAAPQNVSYNASAAPAPSAAPIPENTQSFGDVGTPGYYAVNGIIAAPAGTPAPQYAAAPIAPSTTPTPIAIQEPSAYTPVSIQPAGTVRHTLVQGDTLYSLARKSCSTVADLQRLNHVDDSFYIRAGDDFLLPQGRCIK